jgi:SAM-dependent methyltransferase
VVPRRPSPSALRLSVEGGTTVELLFVEQGPDIFLVASDPAAAWARGAIRSPARIQWPDGREEKRLAELLNETAAIAAVRAAFRDKYGREAWERYYRGRTRVLRLRNDPTAVGRSREELLRVEFDAAAPEYTSRIEQNPFAAYLRQRSEGQFLPTFQDQDPILELGPGTGIETLALLRAGHRVLAVDISPRMLEQLRQRAETAGVASRLETRPGALGDLDTILGDVPAGSIGGALSTFGALNLDPRVDRLPKALARLIAPGAPFFAGILNRTALATAGYLVLSGHPRKAVRRLQSPIPAGALLYALDVRPFTGREFARAFQPEFVLEGLTAASVLAPTFWSPPLYRFWGEPGRRALSRLDAQLSSRWPFRGWGEYLFVTLRRAAPAPAA